MNSKYRAWGLAIAALATIIMWRFPFGGYLLYPLTIMATWFHELGHGLGALLLGGTFHKLQLFGDGSGVAYYSGPLFFGRLGTALVAAAGPLGPALAGSLLILSSKQPKLAKIGLLSLAGIMVLTLAIWIRTLFGALMIGFLVAMLLWIALKGSLRLHVWAVQFLGVNASISVFLQINYLFTRQATIDGQLLYSDTGQIANALFFPFWFWAVFLTALTMLLLTLSLRSALR